MVNYEKQEDREDLFQEVAREAADRLGPAFTDVIGNGGDRYNSCVLRSEANEARAFLTQSLSGHALMWVVVVCCYKNSWGSLQEIRKDSRIYQRRGKDGRLRGINPQTVATRMVALLEEAQEEVKEREARSLAHRAKVEAEEAERRKLAERVSALNVPREVHMIISALPDDMFSVSVEPRRLTEVQVKKLAKFLAKL